MWSNTDNGYTMEALYAVMGTTRQAVHQSRCRAEQRKERERAVLEQVRAIRSQHPRMGSRSLHAMLHEPQMGVTAFERLMATERLTVPRKRKYVVTTQTHADRRFPNLINGLLLNDVNQLIVGDITHMQNTSGVYYVFILKDVYTKYVFLHGSDNMRGEQAESCLMQMMRVRETMDFEGTIHHTDGGGQYRSDAYLDKLNSAKFRISQAYTCLENGIAEQCHDTVKNQYLLHEDIRSVRQLQKALAKIQYLINEERPVKALGNLTPAAFEQQLTCVPLAERQVFTCYDFRAKQTGQQVLQACTPEMLVYSYTQNKQLQTEEPGAATNGIPEDR